MSDMTPQRVFGVEPMSEIDPAWLESVIDARLAARQPQRRAPVVRPYLRNRFQEPSSYAGLGGALVALLATFGVYLPDEMWQHVGLVVGGVASLAAFFMRERRAQ